MLASAVAANLKNWFGTRFIFVTLVTFYLNEKTKYQAVNTHETP